MTLRVAVRFATERRGRVQVSALEATLDQMIESNTAYSKSFRPVNEKRAFEERAQLRARLDKAYDRLKFKRQEERSIFGDVQQAEARLQQLADEEAGLATAVRELEQRRDEAASTVQVCSATLLACTTVAVSPLCACCISCKIETTHIACLYG